MSDADVTATDHTSDDPVHLMAAALGTRHFADLASSIADDAAELVEAVAALGASGTRLHLAQMRRRADAARRHAIRTSEHASLTADALRDVLVAPAADRRRAVRRLLKTAESSRLAILATHRHAVVVGRLAAGIAVRHEPADGPEPIWTVARRLLGNLVLGPGDDDIAIGSPRRAGRAMLTGLVAHAAWQSPAVILLTVDDGSGRHVQATVDAGTLLVESVQDSCLSSSRELSPAERTALGRLGFQPPDGGHLHWWQEMESFAVGDAAHLLTATLVDVHGADLRGVSASIAYAGHHPASVDSALDPAVLDLDATTVPSLGEAMAHRLGQWIDDLGVDAIWSTVDQDGWPHWAHLGSNLDGSLYTEVSGGGLAPEEVAHLRTLGWGDADPQTGMHPRVWPAPFDLDVACWHMALTLVAVHGLQLDEPILMTLEPFG